MLPYEDLSKPEVVVKAPYQEVVDYINNPDKKYQHEVLRVIYERSEEVLKLRDQVRVEARAMEIVALFIKEHDLFRGTINLLKKKGDELSDS